ncbi:MAG TPA: heme-binding domain-containing protein [Saprospiraceae bacterium]|nr:heme-binding domain-containing protein [Saprospiraceae bacterium]
MKRKILIGVIAIFISIQFFRPTKNLSDDNTFAISTKYAMSPEVSKTLDDACYNCHSNKTAYPWYSEIQPVAWWLAHHVDEGKQHLNFSTFTTRRIAVQNHKLEETIEMVKDRKMPLSSYTWLGLHPEAKITDEQREMIRDWAAAQMDTLKMQYPPDSLKMPKRPPPKK